MPEYRLHHGVWHCWRRGTNFHTYCGIGDTAKAAYEDWMRLMTKGPTNAID